MLQASNFISSMELNKGEKIACLEEIAINQRFISAEKVLELCKNYKSDYYKYIQDTFKKQEILL